MTAYFKYYKENEKGKQPYTSFVIKGGTGIIIYNGKKHSGK